MTQAYVLSVDSVIFHEVTSLVSSTLFGNEGVSRITGLIVSMRLYEECHRQDEICSLLICAGL